MAPEKDGRDRGPRWGLRVATAACLVFVVGASALVLVKEFETGGPLEAEGGLIESGESPIGSPGGRGAGREFVEAPAKPSLPSVETPPREGAPETPVEKDPPSSDVPSDEKTDERDVPPTEQPEEKTGDPDRGEPLEPESTPSEEVSPGERAQDPDDASPEEPSPSPELSPDEKVEQPPATPTEQPTSPPSDDAAPGDEPEGPDGGGEQDEPQGDPPPAFDPDDGTEIFEELAAPENGPGGDGLAQQPDAEKVLPLIDQPGHIFASEFDGGDDRTDLVGSVRDVTELSTSSRDLAEVVVLTALLILLIGFPAELFNATLLENYEEISGWFRWAWLQRLRAWMANLPGAVVVVAFAAVGAIIHSQLEANLGFDRGSLALLLGLFGAFLVISLTYDVIRKLHLRRRHELPCRLRAQLIGMVVAAIFVFFSRIGDFHPGYMYGLFTALAFGWELHERHHGRALAIASVRLFAFAAVAWFLWIPVKHMAEEPGAAFWVLTLDATLAVLWVAGVAAIVFGLAPIRFFYGETVKKWSVWGWLAIYVPGVFMFVYTLLHPERGLYGSSHEASLLSVMLLFIGFGLFSVIFWGYFRVRDSRRRPVAAAAAGPSGD